MSKRFPATNVPDSSTTFERVEQKLCAVYGGKAPPFSWSVDGELIGCYTPLLYSQGMIDSVMEASLALYKPDTLKPRLRELAILGLCSIWDVPYVRYCHILGAKQVGLSHDQIAVAVDGQVPMDLNDSEVMAYRFGRTLAGINGPLDDATWNEALTHLSRQEIVGIAHIIGGYKWVSTLVQINDDQEMWREANAEQLGS